MLNKLNVAYKTNGKLNVLPLSGFTSLIKERKVSDETIVFNNMVDTKKGVETQWEVPTKQSWHARFFN